MKSNKTNLKTEFTNFKIGNMIHLKGGLTGVITGSRIYQGETYIDVDYDDGTSGCDWHISSGDGSHDDLVGQTINH